MNYEKLRVNEKDHHFVCENCRENINPNNECMNSEFAIYHHWVYGRREIHPDKKSFDQATDEYEKEKLTTSKFWMQMNYPDGAPRQEKI